MPKLPGVSHSCTVRAFEKAGFWVVREGKHISMTEGERIIIIPRANPINAFTMGGIIKDAGMTVKEFKKLL
ncbi:MAG TPA: type II toxin-antitoxin system HicA family toxin [Sedimentisphaerales bacterium]|nr:type II toxin-antitoxin system HicA family toxin [Sedimentisphaerales bacterium]